MTDFSNALRLLQKVAPPQKPVRNDPLTQMVRDYLREYEYRGDTDYKPVETDLLLDFGVGLCEHLKSIETPIKGYTDQSSENKARVNENKILEERCLRVIDRLQKTDADPRWLSVGRTHLEQAFMAINRAIMKPQRIDIEED